MPGEVKWSGVKWDGAGNSSPRGFIPPRAVPRGRRGVGAGSACGAGPRDSWQDHFADLDAAVAASGLGDVQFVAPFIPTVPGT
ncbi:hypothetical protein ACVNF4_21190, partial [Streptomyces sp. S6]